MCGNIHGSKILGKTIVCESIYIYIYICIGIKIFSWIATVWVGGWVGGWVGEGGKRYSCEI